MEQIYAKPSGQSTVQTKAPNRVLKQIKKHISEIFCVSVYVLMRVCVCVFYACVFVCVCVCVCVSERKSNNILLG